MKFVLIFLIIAQFSGIFADYVELKTQSCNDDDDFFEASKNCKIEKLEAEGCGRQRKATDPCALQRGVNVSFKLEFTPGFDGKSSSDVTMLAYALVGGKETAWPGMEPNACGIFSTGCPLQNGVKTTYHLQNFELKRTYPSGSFPVRFLLKDNEEVKCCFRTRVRIS